MRKSRWLVAFVLLAAGLGGWLWLQPGSPESQAIAQAQGQPKPVTTADLPTDLDLIPRDAAAFFHIRARDIWQSTWLKDARQILDKAGPEAWKEFEKKSPIDPTTIDRVSLVMLTPQTLGEPFPRVDPEAMSAIVVVSTTRPYDRLALLQAAGCREKAYRRNLYFFHEDLWAGLVLVDEKTFLVGSEDAVVRWFDLMRNKSATGPLLLALREATKHHVTFGLNPTLMAKEAADAPEPIQRLLQAHCGIATLDLDKELKLDLRLEYQKADQAEAGEKALRDTFELARQGLAIPIGELERELKNKPAGLDNLAESFALVMGLGFLREIDGMLKDAPIQRQGTSVVLPFRTQKLDSAAGMAVVASVAAIQLVGARANAAFGVVGGQIGVTDKAKDPMQVHLEALVEAMNKYHADKGHYPPPAIYDKDGRPMLSWRVALLPYLGDDAKGLYNSFRLDEPWDSLHNKRVIKKMPKAFQSPNRYAWGASQWKTRDQVFTGPGTVFEGAQGTRKADVGGKTILVAHVANDHAVYWTKPADLAYAGDKPLPPLFGRWEQAIQILQLDGTYRSLNRDAAEKELRDLIQRKK
jgi:hypothetical protein